LTIGSADGSYYVNARDHTNDNFDLILDCVKENGHSVVSAAVDVSVNNKAVKNAPAIFVLAVCAAHGDKTTKVAAFRTMPRVARTSTDFFSFIDQYKKLGGGFGAIAKKGIEAWYKGKDIDTVAYQMIKYRQRDGWTHHDVLHLAHVKPATIEESVLYSFAKDVAHGNPTQEDRMLPSIVNAYLNAKTADSVSSVVKLITDNNLPREAIPSEFLNDIEVWDALLQKMPATALIRNLGKMTNIGLIKPMSDAEKLVISKLSNSDWLAKSRVHPITMLAAGNIYGSGQGMRGSLTWSPSNRVVDSLDNAFYASFKNVPATGKNINLALEGSGS
jgi:60 kDa SS-A/Ro ribonucleoprotein